MSMLICNAKPMQFDSRVAPSIFTQYHANQKSMAATRFDDKVLFSPARISSVGMLFKGPISQDMHCKFEVLVVT